MLNVLPLKAQKEILTMTKTETFVFDDVRELDEQLSQWLKKMGRRGFELHSMHQTFAGAVTVVVVSKEGYTPDGFTYDMEEYKLPSGRWCRVQFSLSQAFTEFNPQGLTVEIMSAEDGRTDTSPSMTDLVFFYRYVAPRLAAKLEEAVLPKLNALVSVGEQEIRDFIETLALDGYGWYLPEGEVLE